MPRRNRQATSRRLPKSRRVRRGDIITVLNSAGWWVPVTVLRAYSTHYMVRDESDGITYIVGRTR